RRVRAVPIKKEIIVVDDASTDATGEIIKTLTGPELKYIRVPVNRGKGAALREGFKYARHEVVVIQDADLEYDPRDYPDLLEPIIMGEADVVYGSRFLTGKSRRVLFYWHSVVNKFLTTLTNMVTNLNLSDMETCYKVFRREIIQGIELKENRFGIEPEMTIKLAKKRARFFEVGISYHGRAYQEGKKIRFKDAIRALFCIFKYSIWR
ncbi:glycosyltransferase family 2 protein, partial [bacterium]|nr:glycosyltransferase family 2 protein [bacterium]